MHDTFTGSGSCLNAPATNDEAARIATPEAAEDNQTATEIISATALSIMDNGQIELFSSPDFCPLAPPPGTLPELLLQILSRSETGITQADWLNLGLGWRLSGAVKTANYLGWGIRARRISHAGRARSIARYTLAPVAKKAALKLYAGAANASQ